MDLSLEHLSADGKSYEYQGNWLPLERRDVTIHVRDAADVTRTILSTRHGPIVSDVLAREDNPLSGVKVRGNYALSMRFAGLTPGPSAASGFASATARTGKDLVEAYRTFTTTPLNWFGAMTREISDGKSSARFLIAAASTASTRRLDTRENSNGTE